MLFPKIKEVVDSLDVTGISSERRTTLLPLIEFVQAKVANDEEIRLNFICTHNSRRSHLSQVWAQAIAFHLGLKNVFSYSGGTEATALFPMAAKALEKSGFKIIAFAEGTNPAYSIKYSDNEHPVIGFSKKYDHDFNPRSGFAAIMTCSQADGNCPFIEGAEKRIPITFEDPKLFDNTPQQEEKYMERSLQIASELFYVFSQIEKKQ
ncbi:arsenate-mycothiol transferase ArsC [Echinicola rosea]|uniref:Arsenate reductase n=1 Tax=Echinicola rosea TaxID=1807691 RepID=A0ABQ1VCU7_9BACT|nr:protein-tyrosine-phosphatase [Echinicola rosea]GGF50967.1 arsenate reductase [Echinicola rosea]|tara:strand:- start:3570 stop:4190 length:621 start_codon:yes stop_codon:yes gene_type:complete